MLDARELYAYAADRGGIDERWIASTSKEIHENRTPDEALGFVESEGTRFTLKEAVETEAARLIGCHAGETRCAANIRNTADCRTLCGRRNGTVENFSWKNELRRNLKCAAKPSI
jgi:hypothetical protein